MTSQIAATPILRGEDAKKVLEDAKQKPTEKSERIAKKWAKIFKSMMKGYEFFD